MMTPAKLRLMLVDDHPVMRAGLAIAQPQPELRGGGPIAGRQDSERLTAREIEVMGLVRSGFTNGETGRVLGISERTVRSHVEIIMRKLGAADRASAVARGFET